MKARLEKWMKGSYSRGILLIAQIIEESDGRDLSVTEKLEKESKKMVKLLKQAAKINDHIQAEVEKSFDY